MTSFEWLARQVPEDHFLCCLCYEAKPVEQAWKDTAGQRWDECIPCAAHEKEAMARELPKLRAELARLRQVEEAARMYLDECECPAPDPMYRRQLRHRLREALAQQVRGDTEGTDDV